MHKDKFNRPSKDGDTIGTQIDLCAARLHEVELELISAKESAAIVAREASELGIGEQAIADRLGVARMTVRSWIGRT